MNSQNIRIRPQGISLRGFSLTELMIVISIMGIMAIASVPAFGKFMQSWRLQGDAGEVAASLRHARNLAVSKNMNVVFIFDQSNGEYFYLQDKDASGTADVGEVSSATRDLSPGITIDKYTMAQQWITFGPKGNTADAGDIVLRNSRNATRTIHVFSGTGNITVQ